MGSVYQQGNDVSISNKIAFAHESITIDNTAGGVILTVNTYTPGSGKRTATEAYLSAETAQMRFTFDGTAPTSSTGHLLNVGESVTIRNLNNITNFKAIRTGSVSGTLKATYLA